MKERPILFSAPMVRAILGGTKTQTRRVVKPQPSPELLADYAEIRATRGSTRTDAQMLSDCRPCPYGQPGDRLWVREAFLGWYKTADKSFSHVAAYRADGYELEAGERWTPSIHMPRSASRITLEVTGVRVERLQDISDGDCLAEGIYPTGTGLYPGAPKAAYQKLWVEINGPGIWLANPWVWVVEFKRLEGGAA